MMNGIWARPMSQAAIEIGVFHWNPLNPQMCSPETFHPWPPSYQRRCIPSIPCKNIGRKITFMQSSDDQKCTLPQKSFIIRTVAFGNHSYMPSKMVKMVPHVTNQWKCDVTYQ